MAEEEEHESLKPHEEENENVDMKKLLRSYIGVSFSVFLALLPNKLRNEAAREISLREELRQLRSRRQEDSKANARVAEIFASHRNAWRDDEKRLLRRIDAAAEEIARLRAEAADSKARVEELEREVSERDEMIRFMSRRIHVEDVDDVEDEVEGLGGCRSREHYGAVAGKKGRDREWFQKEEEEEEMVGTTGNVEEEVEIFYQHHHLHQQQQQHTQQHLGNGFDSEFMASASKFLWQVCFVESQLISACFTLIAVF